MVGMKILSFIVLVAMSLSVSLGSATCDYNVTSVSQLTTIFKNDQTGWTTVPTLCFAAGTYSLTANFVIKASQNWVGPQQGVDPACGRLINPPCPRYASASNKNATVEAVFMVQNHQVSSTTVPNLNLTIDGFYLSGSGSSTPFFTQSSGMGLSVTVYNTYVFQTSIQASYVTLDHSYFGWGNSGGAYIASGTTLITATNSFFWRVAITQSGSITAIGNTFTYMSNLASINASSHFENNGFYIISTTAFQDSVGQTSFKNNSFFGTATAYRTSANSLLDFDSNCFVDINSQDDVLYFGSSINTTGVSFDSVQAPSSSVINIEHNMHDLEENIHNTTTVKGKNIILDGASVEYTDEIPDLDSELLSLSQSIEDLNVNDDNSSLENDETILELKMNRIVESKSIESSPVNLSRGVFFELHNTFTPPASPREETAKSNTSFSPPNNNNKSISNEPSHQTQMTQHETSTQNNATLSPFYRSPDNSSNTVISNPPSPNTAPKINDTTLSPPQTASPVLQVLKPKANTTLIDDGSITASRKALWRSSSNPLTTTSNIGKLPDKGNISTEKSRQSTHIVISETRKPGDKDRTNGKESGNRLSSDSSKSAFSQPFVQKSSAPKTVASTSAASPTVNTKQADPSSSSKKIIAVKENDSVKSLKTISAASKMWSPPRNRVYFNIHTPGKPQDQDYLCAGCGNEFSFGLFSTIRYCEYTGKLYCGKCHVGDSFFVPARVIHDWDHRAFPVSKHAKSFLEKSYREPLFDILAINPTLYKKSQSIASIRILRKQLFFLRDFIMTCTRSNLWKDIGLDTHSYLATEMHLYSLRDLINASDLLENMRNMVEKMFVHIKECELCKAKGSYCEFCSSKDIIYPFQLSLAIQCVGECKGVFHRKCYNKSKCPKCFRIAKRKMVGSIQDQKLMKE